jgi:hypothetical protein
MIRKCHGCTCNSPIYGLAENSASRNIRKRITIVGDYAKHNGTSEQEMNCTYPYNCVSLNLNDQGTLLIEHRSYTQLFTQPTQGAKAIPIFAQQNSSVQLAQQPTVVLMPSRVKPA